jgi:hypothetical protein
MLLSQPLKTAAFCSPICAIVHAIHSWLRLKPSAAVQSAFEVGAPQREWLRKDLRCQRRNHA